MKHFWTTLFATLAVAGSAWAQPTGSPEHRTEGLSRIELGSGVTGLYAGGWVPFPAIQARVNISRRFAADVVTDFDTAQKNGVAGLYRFQIHQTVGAPHQSVTPFISYGVTGGFEYYHAPERRYTYTTGDTVVFPAYRHHEISRPFAVNGGGGVRVRLARRIFLETGVQVAVAPGGGAALVTNVGAVVPVGRLR